VVSSSSFSNFHSIEDADDEDAEKEGPTIDKSTTNPSNVDRASPVSSRPSKKNKTKVDMDELAVDLKDALRVLTTPPVVQPPPVAQVDPVRNACFERLNTLGLDPRDPLFKAAIDILGHTTLLRDAWLMMPPDHDVLTDWIERTGRRVGFLQ